MWSEDLDVIILAGDGDDRDGHAGHGETSKDLSTHHCEEKLFHKYILSGQARPLCLSDLLQDTPTSRGELVSHRPISHGSTCGRCSGTGTRRTTRRMMIHKKAVPDDEMDFFFMSLSFCHSASRSSRTMKSSYNLSLTRCPGISILHSGLA